MKKLFSCLALLFVSLLPPSAFAQNSAIPQTVMLRIVRAEDELRFDRDLQDLLKSPDAQIRIRAALAAGRIGSEKAIPQLSELLDKDGDQDVRRMAAFALGETESATAANAILKALAKKDQTDAVRSRALEAAGKIAAANPKDEKSKDLGESILDALEAEHSLATRNQAVVLLGLTTVLRAKPDEADFVVGKFLTDKNAAVRADALNTLVRLKSKTDNLKAQYRALLLTDDDAVVRANAARALGSSEDALGLDLLIEAATTDDDQRVRVAAIRSLGGLKDKKAATPLLERGEKLFASYKTAKGKYQNPAEKNELLEIVTTLGKLLQNSNDESAIGFLKKFRILDQLKSPETEIAFAKISSESYLRTEPLSGTTIEIDKVFPPSKMSWQSSSSLVQGLAEFANLSSDKRQLREFGLSNIGIIVGSQESHRPELVPAIPDYLRSYAAFKDDYGFPEFMNKDSGAEHLGRILRGYVIYKEKTPPEPFRIVPKDNRTFGYHDIIVRATAAELLGELPASKENIIALKTAFAQALQNDKEMNDAQLAILSALVKLDKTHAIESLKLALDATDFLVRRQAAQLIKENDLTKDFPNLDAKVGTVKPYNPATKTKLGQILNTNADYVRAISRKNGQAKAILTTEKGVFTINLLPEDAPMTVDNFVKLAGSGYFNGIAFHRVVPNFVIQGGDPRGDGNGGPGWQIRCEINMVPFERGAVGMALSGKDTGGSQWFVTHSPQSHLDGGYTVFGRVNEADMKIVDQIARGDKILRVKIIENNLPQRSQKAQRKNSFAN